MDSRMTEGKKISGEIRLGERRCSTTELHRHEVGGGIRTPDHPLKRRSNPDLTTGYGFYPGK